MILVDTNLLLYAVDEESRFHEKSRGWLDDRFSSPLGIALPWQVLNGFVRLVTNPRIYPSALTTREAWAQVEEWLDLESTFTPEPAQKHREILAGLMPHVSRGELMPDAHLAALAIEYGLVLCSADADFDRFPGLAWKNPLLEA